MQETLSPEQIISIVSSLSGGRFIEREKYIIFPTICHNEDSSSASMKLYYYKENKMFHCYTECGESFNIFTLVEKALRIQNYLGGNFSFKDVLKYCLTHSDYKGTVKEPQSVKYRREIDKYRRKNRELEIKTYNKNLINMFSQSYPKEWVDEGISAAAMDKFNIRYSISQKKIIIPHYNINGDLIGIRGRALDPVEIELCGKYRPVKIEDTLYAHPLSQNLYGLDLNKAAIDKTKKVIVYEAEKSVLMHESYFKENNSVAICGSNFNKMQLELILKNTQANEIILALDRDYIFAGDKDGQKCYKKNLDIVKKYSLYTNISFIFDNNHLLGYKDSPIDKGKDIFNTLYANRIKFWKEN